MTHHVELPDDVYRELAREAQEQGVTLAQWIAARLSRNEERQPEDRPLREVLRGLVGSFDSSKEQFSDQPVSAMAEMVADKLQKQGIEAPWRRQR